MSQGFNAYREWLGIAGQSEIPSYYELLGLRPLESDTAQIEAAYQRQSARLAARLSGGQADVAQRLMGELAEARLTLLTPTAKRAYDTALAGAAGSAAPSATSPIGPAATFAPVSPQPAAAYPATPQPVPRQQFAPGYGGYAGGYPPVAQPTGPGYPVAQAYPAPQAYPGWQTQPTAAGTVPGYYPTAAAPVVASGQPAAEELSIPSIRRRRVRRRSSPVPAVVGVLAVLAILGGTYLYFNHGQTVAVVDANRSATNGQSPGSSAATKPGHKANGESVPKVRPETKPARETPHVKPPPRTASNTARQKPTLPATEDEHAGMEKPDARQPEKPDAAMPEPEKPTPDSPVSETPAPNKPVPEKPVTDKPEAEKPKEEPVPEAKATPAEAAKVGTLLKSARAALANREISKAQDLLAEATIEATAPDTTAEVGHVELLVSYVEMFWDAVRQTLPKIALEELEINGTMMAVVEADENHLIVRAEGKNHDYKWQKLPRSIAYYLANRWLAPEDPVRNLVLASFEIVDPKGDRKQAESLLDAATAGGLNAGPLMDELKIARGK